MDLRVLLEVQAKNFSDIQLIVVGSTLIFLIGAAFLLIYVNVYNEKKKKHMEEKLVLQQSFRDQLLQSQIEVQEATFSSLGKELHDNVGQLLGTAKMLLGVSQRNLPASADTIKTADETLSKAIHELRSLSKTLNKEWLEQFDFKQNLETEIGRINSARTLIISLTDATATIGLSAEQQIILFRIVQEALQNAVKHADASLVKVNLETKHDMLRISIADNGKGMSGAVEQNGVGIINMKHRVALLNGSIEWTVDLPGTNVIIQIPLQPVTT